jgi:hypothetical protein
VSIYIPACAYFDLENQYKSIIFLRWENKNFIFDIIITLIYICCKFWGYKVSKQYALSYLIHKHFLSINYCGYYTRIVHHNRVLKSFIMQFIILDLRFIITSLVLKFMEINKIEMKEPTNEHTIHTNKHKM